jgi:TPR repeat protein
VTKERLQAALASYKAGNFKAALPLYRALADEGDAFAQFSIGYMYRRGEGVAKDEAEAVKWYRKAAEQGYPTAQSNLGFMYQVGAGVPQDLDEAAAWFRKASAQGDATAQLNLMVLVQTIPLLPLMDKLSSGDLSTMLASLDKPESRMMTVEGSANDVAWSEMVRLGWMNEPQLGTVPGVPAKVFTITDVGRMALPRALRVFAGWSKARMTRRH